MKSTPTMWCRWICWWGPTGSRRRIVCRKQRTRFCAIRFPRAQQKNRERSRGETGMGKNWMLAVLFGALLASPAMLSAQEPPPDGPPPPHGGMGRGGEMGPRMEILGFEEMHPGKVVTGAPYSAITVIVTTQTLADGTSINRKIQANVVRDSQGRVRRDTTMPAIGPLAANGQPRTFILIHDPVAGTAFELHPDTKTAVQLPVRTGGRKNPDGLQSKFDARLEEEVANGTLKKDDLGTQS